MVLDVGVEQAEGGEEARRRRHDHAADAERRRHAAGEQGAVAAEGEERELPRVAAALGRDRLDGADHVGGGDLVRAIGGGLQAHAQGFGYGRGKHRARLVGIESEGAADEVAGVQVAQDDVGVGDGRDPAAGVVANGPRRGAGALGPHLQRAAGIDPHVRAAARAHLGQIDGGNLERVAGARQQARADHDAGAHRVLLRAHHLAVLDHGGLGGRAAHVEGDDAVEPARERQRLRADHAAGGTRTR